MKNSILLLLLAAVSCQKGEPSREVTSPTAEEETEWITYEGRVPLGDDRALYIEISMRAGNDAGEGEFLLEEHTEGEAPSGKISSLEGEYTSLRGEEPEERIIQFHHTALSEGVKRTFLTQEFEGNVTGSRLTIMREESFRKRDLTVKIVGRNKLIVLDDHLHIISDDADHNLVRRLAKPFTIEGYFRHNGFSADFVEMNTGERWVVAKYGAYEKAIRLYYELTENKFDVTYLKGIGFPVDVKDRDGKWVQALVIKRVLQMTTAQP